MRGHMQDKVAFVTGGSSGIGLAIAKRFAADGASVFVTGRRQEELGRALAEIGTGATGIRADSSVLGDLDRAYRTVKDQTGRIDVLVANAGILEHAPISNVDEGHFDRLFSVNVKGLVFTVQKGLQLMPDGGSIILMSSTVASKGLGGSGIYAATKAAIRSFARTWIVDLKDRRIRVNAISPGAVRTPGIMGAASGHDARNAILDYLATQTPLGRIGVPDDIANVAAFLASDEASFVNGADIQVDGGWAQI